MSVVITVILLHRPTTYASDNYGYDRSWYYIWYHSISTCWSS